MFDFGDLGHRFGTAHGKINRVRGKGSTGTTTRIECREVGFQKLGNSRSEKASQGNKRVIRNRVRKIQSECDPMNQNALRTISWTRVCLLYC